ncbi:hypothetical protein LCGC14_0405310 [marine sediment metagenome]|uniref:Uncharacterized protein n=1 Tax=marine sediment metagenome TaxID=412755 RepID=A0A0F9TDI6_9ZZZZ
MISKKEYENLPKGKLLELLEIRTDQAFLSLMKDKRMGLAYHMDRLERNYKRQKEKILGRMTVKKALKFNSLFDFVC